MDVRIEPSWKAVLQDEFDKPYFANVVGHVKSEIAERYTVYPPGRLIFNAFDKTPFDRVKVVILGQDPYHGYGQAHGLCFSVPQGVKAPPSLINIFKEIGDDLGIAPPNHGCLEAWAEQGVFLLNAILTVRANTPTSHSAIGWQTFTDAVIRKISDQKSGVVFLLWGNFARAKKELINTEKHHVLEAAHPSPLARGAFNGCRHFSKTNALLQQQGLQPIDWKI
ncbi:MAG: uracil-DNA glycosylase [Prevotellaceae bacterium]|jgi:uracil-DNA glycosylase|nr:uracil-DNA glycosylase [Prevotellaceae bacterium]